MFFSATAQTNSGSVGGKLTDESGEGLEYATVVLHNSADSAIVKAGYTDGQGTYLIAPVPAGNYYVRTTYVGYPPTKSAPFVLAQGEQLTVPTIQVQPSGTQVADVRITTERPLVTVKPDMTVFNVEGTVNAVGENAFTLLRKSPGVAIDNNDNIMLLGKSGVRIYIDGKPSPLSAADLANMLKSMQSDQIESFEIITNPSSKYDAEGNAGIINVRLKRDKSMGTNATLNLDYSAWIYNRFNGSLSLNYRSKKFNAFGSYGAGIGKQRNFMNFYRAQSGTSFTQATEMVNDYLNQNFRGGMDFYLAPKHTVGFIVNGFLSDGTLNSTSNNDIRDIAKDSLMSLLRATSANDFSRSNVNSNLNYRYDSKKGTTLNVDADYGTFDIVTNAFAPNLYLDPETNAVLADVTFSSNAPTAIDIYTLKADYERTLGKGKVGLGFKTAYVQTSNTFDFYNLIGGVEVLDTTRTNTFDYTENVNAAYLNYQRQIKKFGIQAGVRAEQTNSLGVLTALQSTDNDRVERHYLNLFPSGGVTYNHNQLNTFRFTYSRRIDRPRYEDLNPFEMKLDELSYRKGNPFLKPQYTHNMELGYTYKYTLNASLSYAITTDFFTNLTDTIEGVRTFMAMQNLSTRKVATFSLSYPWSPVKWWSTYTNASVFNSRQEADFGVGKDIDVSRTTFSAFHQSSFTLPKNFGVQVSGFYSSPGIWGANFLTRRFWGVETGVTKKLFKERGLFKVGISDIFFTMQWAGEMSFGALYNSGGGGWESRQIKASYTHTFGNTNVKGARKRATGLDDEQKRAGSGGDNPGR
jgi:iron complex outermembrane recepter protein